VTPDIGFVIGILFIAVILFVSDRVFVDVVTGFLPPSTGGVRLQ